MTTAFGAGIEDYKKRSDENFAQVKHDDDCCCPICQPFFSYNEIQPQGIDGKPLVKAQNA